MNQVPQARMPNTPPKTAADQWNAALTKARKANQRERSRIVANFGENSRQVRDFDVDCQRQYRRMRDEFAYARPAMDDEHLRALKQEATPSGTPSEQAQRAADKAVAEIASELHELPAAEPEGQRAPQSRRWRDAVFFMLGVAVGGGALVALALMNPPVPAKITTQLAIEEHGPATNIGNGIARTDDWERGISCYAHVRGLSCTAMPAEAPAVAATLGKVVL